MNDIVAGSPTPAMNTPAGARSTVTMTGVRLLVLGGTDHVGRAVVEEALAR